MDVRPRTSTREPGEVAARLAAWLGPRLGADRTPSVVGLDVPSTAGFSSETLLLDLAWTAEAEPRAASYVVRLPPADDAFPLFPHYDLARQVAAMRFVRERTAVPVPAVPWYEPDSAAVGAPFFVMERVDGVAVPDLPPYVMGSWLSEAPADAQGRVAGAMIGVVAGIHGAASGGDDLAFLDLDVPGSTALERHVANQRAYYDWIRGDRSFPLVDRTFAWLDDHWPADEGPAVVSWGDARLANVLWCDFEPVAVLDWEAAATGPRELDLGWLVFFHEYFQRIGERYGRPGMPNFLRRREVVAEYERRTGHVVADFDWYLMYAELRQALTSIRVSSRQVHFGERPPPDDPEDLILERDHLADVIGDTRRASEP